VSSGLSGGTLIEPRRVYLTFDDGPDGPRTERVLDVLRARDVRATFFLIGEKLRPQVSLVRRMVAEGHALGNHSWDHKYRNYFLGALAMRAWIEHARLEFRALGLPRPVGFRPPAGVVTPVVRRVLRELDEPLILWDERFYDGVWPWTEAAARRSAARLSAECLGSTKSRQLGLGNVVLLHDRQPESRSSEFCRVLELYIGLLRERGFEFAALQPATVAPGSVQVDGRQLPLRKQPASSNP